MQSKAIKSDCPYRSRLDAYHDGELDADAQEQFQSHLMACAACAAELRQMQRVSGLFNEMADEPMSGAAVARVHDAVDAVEDEPSLGIGRIAAVLTALAASVLIVGSAWLWDAPGRPVRSPLVAGRIVPTPAWERVAMTLRTDPLARTPWEVNDRTRLAYENRLTRWMVRDLTGEAPDEND